MADNGNVAKLQEIHNAYVRRAKLWKEFQEALEVAKGLRTKFREADAALVAIVGERTVPLFQK